MSFEKTYQYEIKRKDLSCASLISAPLSELQKFGRPKEEEFPSASYIWPYGCTRLRMTELPLLEP